MAKPSHYRTDPGTQIRVREKRQDMKTATVKNLVILAAVVALWGLWRIRAEDGDDETLLNVILLTSALLAVHWVAHVAELKGHRWARWLRRYVESVAALTVAAVLLDIVGIEGPALGQLTYPLLLVWALASAVVIPACGLVALARAVGDARPGSWWHIAYERPFDSSRTRSSR